MNKDACPSPSTPTSPGLPSPSPPPMPPSTKYLMIFSVAGSALLPTFQSGCLTVALPTIQKSLNIDEANLQWPLTAYSLTYGCFLLLSGRLADIFGRRLLFLLGNIWFVIVSIAVAFAPNPTSFIILMALLGLGPATFTPAGVGLFGATFEGETRAKAFAAIGVGQPLGGIMGLVLGGFLCQTAASWRSFFWVQAGCGLVFIVLGWFSLPLDDMPDDDTTAKRVGRIDWVGAFLITTALALFNFSLAGGPSAPQGWRTPYIPVLLCISIILFAGFLWWEHTREKLGKSVMIPLSIFRVRHVGILLAVVLAAWWSFNSIMYFSTLYYQSVLLLNPIQTSLRFIPLAIAGTCLNIAAGFLVSRARPHYLIIGGLLGSSIGAILFAVIDVHASYWSMALLVMILIAGPDLAYCVCNIQVCAAVDKQSQSLAGGLFAATTRIGTSIGLALTSTISTAVSDRFLSGHPSLLASSPSVLLKGYRAAGWVCFAAAAIAIVMTAFGLHNMPIVIEADVESYEMGEGRHKQMPQAHAKLGGEV
ncbi:hypothetical protein BOTBODRAFT_38288 [Botryobasidium botryosum FD-172 SS1]|uniref:Major facilitator superfamily (MFS) profile domain-containing protein n=1 Tax=Botryobasidium botryosum (strain FD-172 SS1) TaxID=930990 RepID=A0A067LXE9_BOTB1|nr:hypothetical protein BOTBODRAFT_38288 [Botryobasidium botryosum FD-172 SS1]